MKENLENKIRKALPRLKEIVVGLKFIDKLDFKAEIVYENVGTYYFFSESDNEVFSVSSNFFDGICKEVIGHPIKLNDVFEYAKLKSNFKELFYYYCSADQSENSESDDTFESNFRDYKTIFKDLYYDDEEGYHPDYDGDILYKAIVRTEIYNDDKGYYNHRFVIEPNDFILRNWNLSSVFLADQNEELINFLNTL